MSDHHAPTCVARILEGRARLTPSRLALVDADTSRRYSFADLEARASAAARYLKTLGVEKGDRVALLARNGVHYTDLFFASGKIGAIFTPLSWRLALPELEEIAADAGGWLLFYEECFAGEAKDLAFPTAISLDEYEDALYSSAGLLPSRDVSPEDHHCLLYTSGTTGKPRGALLSHRMIVWNSINTVMSWGLREDDIAPLFTPQFHSGGLNVLMVPLIHIGGRIIVTREFNPGPALRLIERERATIVFMVPSMFRMIAEAPELATTDLGSVRFFLSGGAPCPADLMDLFRRYGKPFRQGFGMTEAGVNCFSMTDEESELKSGSVGKPVLHGSARLADESGRDVPRGEMGELLLRGPHIFSGYFGKDEDTARSFIDGWLRTEDLARIDGDGFFFIVGRKKDMIISGGENVYLAEVENVIALHPCVKEAAVIGVPDEKWGETGRALVVVSPGEPFSEEEIRAFCARHLARYKIPKTFLPVDALPRNPYGKLLRAELVRLYGAP